MRDSDAAAMEKMAGDSASSLRGTNQSGMRAHNERLVLSLLRSHGALAKSDIARMTGLSAQTVSVIMRQLEQEGLLERGAKVRGRIGQPSVPMSLAADGAFFFGLKVGRRSADLVLVDFLGKIRASRRWVYAYPTPDNVVRFVAEALPLLRDSLAPALRSRIMGMGIATPFQLWNWVKVIGAPQEEMDAWRDRDIGEEISRICDLPVQVQNDATSACGAELIFGTQARSGETHQDFLYFYFGTLIGGGLVMNGRLFLGRNGNAAGIGPMPVLDRSGTPRRLLDVASLSVLAEAMEAAGEESDYIWEGPEAWQVSPPVLSAWVETAAKGLASAILAAAALVEIEAVVIDGWIPQALRADLVAETRAALMQMDLAGIEMPVIREGSIGPDARALGAAAIPLAQRYLLDQSSLT